MTLKSNPEELALIAHEIEAEVTRGTVRYLGQEKRRLIRDVEEWLSEKGDRGQERSKCEEVNS